MNRYSCYNRSEYWDELTVQDGWTDDGRRKTKTVPFVMSKECEYVKEHSDDASCRGCIWNKGVSTERIPYTLNSMNLP